jgi:hypothetical protein
MGLPGPSVRGLSCTKRGEIAERPRNRINKCPQVAAAEGFYFL